MSQYATPPDLSAALEGRIDPNRGFLCMTSHWRPDPKADDPEMPGQKLAMSSFIPAHPREACLCGSGRRFGDCCQRKRLWHPICPNPDMEGYSLTKPQSAIFRRVDGAAVRERLTTDPRFRCTEDTPARAFWAFHGEPLVEDEYGILSFGDLELEHNRTLVASAMSDLRMEVLLDALDEVAGDLLGKPRMKRDPERVIDKRTGKMRTLKGSDGPPGRRAGRKRRGQ